MIKSFISWFKRWIMCDLYERGCFEARLMVQRYNWQYAYDQWQTYNMDDLYDHGFRDTLLAMPHSHVPNDVQQEVPNNAHI